MERLIIVYLDRLGKLNAAKQFVSISEEIQDGKLAKYEKAASIALDALKKSAYKNLSVLKDLAAANPEEYGREYSIVVERFGKDLEKCGWTPHDLAALNHLL